MATFNTQKVVLLGHPLVGKTSVVRALAKLKGTSINVKMVNTSDSVLDRGPAATWQEGGRQFEVSTLAGAVWDPDSWRTLITSGTKCIFLLDAQKTCRDLAIVELLKIVRLGLGPLAAVQITKIDLCAAGIACLDFMDFSDVLNRLEIPCFISRHDQPHTQVAACCHVLGCSAPEVD